MTGFSNFFRLESSESRILWPAVLAVVLLCGLTARLAFSFYLSKFYYGDVRFTFGDSFSYTESFLNLLNYGHYTFDIGNTDAYIYRGPAYPLFWGAHYLVFGPDMVYQAVAFIQSILDTGTGFLMFLILRHLNVSNTLSLFGSTLYIFNPIFLVHVPITGTETFATFITVFLVYLVTTHSNSSRWLVVIGITCGIAVLTRQYLGLFLPIIMVYVYFKNNDTLFYSRRNFIKLILLGVGFLLTIAPWHLRNITNHNVNSFLMGNLTGYAANQEDFVSFQNFYSLYFVDYTKLRHSVSRSGVNSMHPSDFPYTDFQKLQEADKLAFSCGPSFLAWRGDLSATRKNEYLGCKEEVRKAYDELRHETLQNAPDFFQFKQPIENIFKSVFKISLSNPFDSWKDLIISMVFVLRTLIILGAISSIFILQRSSLKVFMLFPICLITYISFIIKQVEIRYLVQADAIMIIFFVMLINNVYRAGEKHV